MSIIGTARITQIGIVFEGLIFTCQRAIKEQWFSRNFEEMNELTVRYCPDDLSSIILIRTGGEDVCRIVNITPYDGKRLTDYHVAMECMKDARRKFISNKYMGI